MSQLQRYVFDLDTCFKKINIQYRNYHSYDKGIFPDRLLIVLSCTDCKIRAGVFLLPHTVPLQVKCGNVCYQKWLLSGSIKQDDYFPNIFWLLQSALSCRHPLVCNASLVTTGGFLSGKKKGGGDLNNY